MYMKMVNMWTVLSRIFRVDSGSQAPCYPRLGCRVWLPCSETLGSFCNENGSGFESATMKMNLLFSKLCRVYSNLLKMPKVDLNLRRTAPMRKKNLSWYVYILHKTSTEKNLTSWPCMGGKEMYYKLFCAWKIVVLIIEPIPSLKFSLPSLFSLLVSL